MFTNQPFNGAQITVFPNASGLDQKTMQTLANEMSMTETVFVFPTENERHPQVRIFSPLKEVGFGSHTTLAAAHVLTSTKSIPFDAEMEKYKFAFGASDVDVHVSKPNGNETFTQFSLTVEPIVDKFVPTRDELSNMLGVKQNDVASKPYSPRVVSCGTPFLIVPLTSAEAVQEAVFNTQAWRAATTPATWTEEILLVSRQRIGDEGDFYARLVGPNIKTTEEPPIGAAIPAFSGYLCSFPDTREGTHTFSVTRGGVGSRRSVLHVEMDHKHKPTLTIRVGGGAVMMAEGKIKI